MRRFQMSMLHEILNVLYAIKFLMTETEMLDYTAVSL